MLGVVFGVAAVISMTSIGAGAREEALRQIALLGVNSVRIEAKELKGEDLRDSKRKSAEGLTRDDMVGIREVCPLVAAAAPIREIEEQVSIGSRQVEANVIATDPEFLDVTGFKVSAGRFLAPGDNAKFDRVCVLGSTVKRDLFANRPAVGERLKIRHDWYTVVGEMDRLASAGKSTVISIRDMNKDVYVPVMTAMRRFPRKWNETTDLAEINVRVTEQERVTEAASIIRRILERRHMGVKDYEIVIPEELLRQSQRTQRIFNVVMGCIAGISLLVGGIGIMNIMLATVTERTREIGLRRAVGAKKVDILSQFLVECMIISCAGGVIGVGMGSLMAHLIMMYAKWSTIISPAAIVLAFGVSVAVGIVFGIYPASRAANLDPVVTLRYE
jgi:putative ABC transport system permease protein